MMLPGRWWESTGLDQAILHAKDFSDVQFGLGWWEAPVPHLDMNMVFPHHIPFNPGLWFTDGWTNLVFLFLLENILCHRICSVPLWSSLHGDFDGTTLWFHCQNQGRKSFWSKKAWNLLGWCKNTASILYPYTYTDTHACMHACMHASMRIDPYIHAFVLAHM